MKILVTGANGFIGSRTCQHLISQHHEVIGLVRKNSNLSLLEGMNLKLSYGDITDPDSLKGLFQGVDIVVHTAGAVIDWGPYAHFEKHNVSGTKNIAKEAEAAGVKRMVQISSVAVHGFGIKNAVETQQMIKSEVAYSQSKIETESWLNEFAKQSAMEVVIVRPGNVFGPHDEKFIAPYLDLIRKGQFVFVNEGKSLTCPTYIENLVHGIELACFHPKANGETFIITDGLEIEWKEFTDALHHELNIKPTKRSIPFIMVYFIAYLMELTYKVLRIETAPLLTRYRINNAGKDYHFSVAKANKLLGYKPVADLNTSVKRTVDWYKKHRDLKRK
jgi:nucleoside-diphosphate-sugar epimerase